MTPGYQTLALNVQLGVNVDTRKIERGGSVKKEMGGNGRTGDVQWEVGVVN